MKKITSKALLRKNYILPIFFILCSFFTGKNAFSAEEWNWKRSMITLVYGVNDQLLLLGFVFTGFDIGANHKHGYLERCDFEFSTDGDNYKTLAMCEVNDHTLSELFWVKMTNKLADAKIEFKGSVIPQDATFWEELTNPWVAVKKSNPGTYWGILSLLWYVPDGVIIKYLRATGKWTIDGFNCPDYFEEIYDLSKPTFKSELKSKLNIDLKQEDEKGNAKVSAKADAILIQGAERGEKINIYTTFGDLVKSIVANDVLINIQLPAKQIYIVNVGHTCYKVVL